MESLEPTLSWSCLDFGAGVGEVGVEYPYVSLWTTGRMLRGTLLKRAWATRKKSVVQ